MPANQLYYRLALWKWIKDCNPTICRKIDNKVIQVEGEIYQEVDTIAFRFYIANITPHSPDDGSVEPKRYSVDFLINLSFHLDYLVINFSTHTD